MKLSIPPLSQRDPRWARKILGSNGTIGRYGCLLVCHTMMLNYYGHEFTPDTLNAVYKEKGVYDRGNLINFWEAAKVFGDITADEWYDCPDVPADLTKIDKYLDKRLPVIAGIGAKPDKPTELTGKIEHFILIIGKSEDGAYFINDPWEGETYYFHAKYGDPKTFIYGLRLYSGTPKEGETLDDKVSDLLDKLKTCNKALAEKSIEVNTLRDELEVQERDNKDLAQQLVTARSERDKEAWEKKQIELKNQSLVEKINKLEQENKDLRAKVKALKENTFDGITKWEALALVIAKFFKKEVNVDA